MANQPISKAQSNQPVTRENRPTTKFESISAFADWYNQNQVARSILNYIERGYSIDSVGWRSTKNENVTEIRVLVKTNENDSYFDQQDNAVTLVRLSYAGVRDPRCYSTDDRKRGYFVVSFFCFDEKPYQPR